MDEAFVRPTIQSLLNKENPSPSRVTFCWKSILELSILIPDEHTIQRSVVSISISLEPFEFDGAGKVRLDTKCADRLCYYHMKESESPCHERFNSWHRFPERMDYPPCAWLMECIDSRVIGDTPLTYARGLVSGKRGSMGCLPALEIAEAGPVSPRE